MTAPKIVMPSQIVMRATASLIGYARNSRTHSAESVRQLADNIERFGWTQPVLIDGNRGVIAGHGRLMAADLLGLVEVPCIELRHLTDDQKRALVIWDNRSAELSDWSEALLAQELADLSGVGIEATDLGFDAAEVDRLMETLGVDFGGKAEGDPDAVPEAPVVPTSKLGDVWLLGRHRVMCGDSTDRAQVDRLMDGEKAQTFFIDPPYGDFVGGLRTKAAHEREKGKGLVKRVAFIANDKDIDWLQEVFETVPDFLEKPSTKMVFFKWDRFSQITEMAASWGEPTALCVWDRCRKASAFFRFQPQHELCLHWGNQADKKSKSDLSNVWRVPKEQENNELHPTVKPIAILEPAISVTTDIGAIVLDLFGGSGSTLIACEKTGREARLMELAPNYVDVIVRRWQDYTGQAATLDGDGRTFAEIAEVRHAAH
jgi:DNA modification methylase